MIFIAAIVIWSTKDISTKGEVVKEVMDGSLERQSDSNNSSTVIQNLVLEETNSSEDNTRYKKDQGATDYSAAELDGSANKRYDESAFNIPSNLNDEPEKQPLLGNDRTAEQWEARRLEGGQAEAFLLPDDQNSQLSAEQLSYATKWKEKALSDQQRIADIESDARRLSPDFIGSPSIEKQENVRSQGEEAERLLAPHIPE